MFKKTLLKNVGSKFNHLEKGYNKVARKNKLLKIELFILWTLASAIISWLKKNPNGIKIYLEEEIIYQKQKRC